MANPNWKMKIHVNILKVAVALLILILHYWIALSQPTVVIFGLCTTLCLTSLIGFMISQRMLFTVPHLILAVILVYIIITASPKELTSQMIYTLQFFTLIYTIEAGATAIQFNRIIQRIKGQTHIPLIAKAIRKYMINLTTVITTAYALTSLLLLIGNLAQTKFEYIFIVAAATATLLAALAFLASNLQSK